MGSVATINNIPAGSGLPNQGHLFYAVNNAAWWVVYLDSGDTTHILARYSTDGMVTWSAAIQTLTVDKAHGNDGRQLAVVYKNISGNDVVHLDYGWTTSGGQPANNYYARGNIGATSITWTHSSLTSADDVSGNDTSANIASSLPDGVAIALGSDNKPHVNTGYVTGSASGNFYAVDSANADSGTAWTFAFSAFSTVVVPTDYIHSRALLPLASALMLGLTDNAPAANAPKNILWQTGPSWSTATQNALAAATTAAFSPEDWCACRVDDTHVYLVVKDPDNSNAFKFRMFNGVATWSTPANLPPTFAMKAGGGLFLVSDGTDLWLFAIATASGNDIQFVKYTVAAGTWGSWAALGLASATRNYLSGYQSVGNKRIGLIWTEGTGNPYSLVSGAFLMESYTPSGGVTTAGTAPVTKGKVFTPSGGLSTGGAAPVAKGKAFLPSGGLTTAGAAIKAKGKAFLPSGGLATAGAAATSGPVLPPGPTLIYRGNLFVRITIDGVEIINGEFAANNSVLSFRAVHGYDVQMASAEIQVPELPSWIHKWSVVQIESGASPATSKVRFVGLFVQPEYTLFPREVRLICRGFLILAQLEQNNLAGGTDLVGGGAGATDQAIVTALLGYANLTEAVTHLNINGTGLLLGTVAIVQYKWAEGESALAAIQKFDAVCLGYRTYDTPSGAIFRTKVSAAPGTKVAATFQEGVDIFRATNITSVLEAKNRIIVTGYNDGTNVRTKTVEQDSPFLPRLTTHITQQLNSPLIERSSSADAGNGLSCEDVALWLLPEVNRTLEKLTFTTPRDDQIVSGDTIGVFAPNRLGMYLQTDSTPTNPELLRVQHVEFSISPKGELNQVLTCLGGQGSNYPILESPVADFAMTVQELEAVLVAGSPVNYYTIQCVASAHARSGSIVSYAWTCSAGANPATGTNSNFTTTFTNLTGATITLTVTDSNGLTDAITRHVPTTVERIYVNRKLFLAGGDCIEAYDGTWQSVAESAAAIVSPTGNAWADGDTVYSNTDSLHHSPNSAVPFGAGVNVTALYVKASEPQYVLAGSIDGRLAFSSDYGLTWTAKNSPLEQIGGHAILRCFIDPSDKNRWYILTDNYFFAGWDNGNDPGGGGWTAQAVASPGETFRDIDSGFGRWMIVMLGGSLAMSVKDAGNIVVQSFPALTPAVSDVIAVAHDIRSDRFYCYDSSGRTFYHTADGGTVFSRLTDLPGALTPKRLGLREDTSIAGLLYIAGGAGGVYKSIDGFNSGGGYLPLRQPGNDGAPAGAVYYQVGISPILLQSKISPTVFYSGLTAKILNLWNGASFDPGPAGWPNLSFSDGAWASAVTANHGTEPIVSGSVPIWYQAAPSLLLEECLIRQVIALGAGVISSAVLHIMADDQFGVVINGIFVKEVLYAGSLMGQQDLILDPSILRPNENNIIAIGATSHNSGTLPGTNYSWVSWSLEVS